MPHIDNNPNVLKSAIMVKNCTLFYSTTETPGIPPMYEKREPAPIPLSQQEEGTEIHTKINRNILKKIISHGCCHKNDKN